MTARRALSRLTQAKLDEIRSAQLGILVMARSTCGRCDVYQADIERLMDRGEFLGIPFGKVVLDEPSAARYVSPEDLAIDMKICPVTVIYENGEEVDRFSTSRASYLLRRISLVQGYGSAGHAEQKVQGGTSSERNGDAR